MSKTEPDWDQIEIEYRYGYDSIRTIAERHGVPHSTVHSKATQNGWERPSKELKNKLVSHALSTGPLVQPDDECLEYNPAKDIVDRAKNILAQEVAFDVLILSKAAANTVTALDAISDAFETQRRVINGAEVEIRPDAKEINALCSANKTCMETFKSIRGLKDPTDDDDGIPDEWRDIMSRYKSDG